VSSFDEFAARATVAEKAHSENFLGRLIWYSVSEVKVLHADLGTALIKTGLNAYLPRVPLDADVFRRVSKAAQRRKLATQTPGIFHNFLVREVAYDDQKVYRRIVQEEVDQGGKRLDYKEVMELNFDRASSTIEAKPLNGVDPEVDAMVAEIKREFVSWKGCINSYAVRELIRRIVMSLNGTLVRPGGGIYFVDERNAPTVDKLEQLASYLPGTTHVHSLPLVDDQKQREMVRQAFEAEASDEIDAMLSEISDIKQKGVKITSDRYAQFATRFQDLQTKAKEYSGLLEASLTNTHSRLTVFQTSMVSLMAEVKH
jgi:hypothetical protein